MSSSVHIEGTCVAINGAGVLLRGKSGSGKSDLALRLINNGAILIGDDQLLLTASSNGLIVSVPPTIAGMLEMRGVGIIRLPYQNHTILSLAIDLVESHKVERYPNPMIYEQLGQQVPRLELNAFESSTPAKIKYALHAFLHNSFVEQVNTECA